MDRTYKVELPFQRATVGSGKRVHSSMSEKRVTSVAIFGWKAGFGANTKDSAFPKEKEDQCIKHEALRDLLLRGRRRKRRKSRRDGHVQCQDMGL